ncbi:MAG: Uncharacterized protein G01um101425_503 [Candidatus Peregrinibacteria bacterium Gr01-1014_25]|nr:MAG: Uncharacterized protein G01um101425_503 [Candidatus Peregrinibacteria bacterium Gr01-1014_25]
MPARELPPLSKQVTIIIGLTVVGFMAFGLTLSFYRNILFEQTLAHLSERNRLVAQDIETQYADLAYVRSEQFKDKFAKENLGRINPGERVLVLTEAPRPPAGSTQESVTDRERREAAYLELLRQMPVIEHWKLYLLHRDKLQELRKAL